MELSMIIGMDPNQVIGVEYKNMDTIQNSMCMYNAKDRAQVKQITTYSKTGKKNVILVGRKTYDTLPESVKKCSRRQFVVLTRNLPLQNDTDVNSCATYVVNVRQAISWCMQRQHEFEDFFIFGGKQIYHAFLTETNLVTKLYVSTIYSQQHFPISQNMETIVFDLSMHLPKFTLKQETKFDDVTFSYYERTYLPYELQYIKLMHTIQNIGFSKCTRLRWTKSIDGYCLQYDLRDGFPITTLRKGFPRGIFAEFLWMLSGSTDVSVLKNQNIHIWDKHSSQEHFDESGITHLKTDDIGPGYGFQLRHCGAEYIDCKTDYSGQGIDQLVNIIHLVKNDPGSRRMMINLWNVKDVPKMALPCCHYNYQFTVQGNQLNATLSQRSWDATLGWNDPTLALFMITVAHFCDLEFGIATHFIHDVHNYDAHEKQIQQMLQQVPYILPTLRIVGPKPATIDGYTLDQFFLQDYQCGPAIKMELQ